MAVIAMSTIVACGTSEPIAPIDAGERGDTSTVDGADRNAPTEPDALPDRAADDVSAPSESGSDGSADTTPAPDANATSHDAADADTTLADSSGADPDAMLHDAADAVLHDAADAGLHDGADGDGGCQCIAWNDDAGPEYVTSVSLECFLIGAAWAYDYSAYQADPCIGLHGRPSVPITGGRTEATYADQNLIGVWTSDRDSPRYTYFYDATTKALVGAMRTSWWYGGDPLDCTRPSPNRAYTTVSAGRLPECDATCLVTSQRELCRPSDGGATVADANGD